MRHPSPPAPLMRPSSDRAARSVMSVRPVTPVMSVMSVLVLCALVIGVFSWTAPVTAHATETTATETPATGQAGQPVVIRDGHVDFGPVVTDGTMSLQLRDDTIAPPQWRNPQDMVLVLDNTATQRLPDGNEFEFTGATGGQNVWVIPQTQKPGVPWLGWNTQSPTLEGVVDRGVTFTYEGHQGPGNFSLFLQDGGLNGAEKVFIDTGDTAWVDLGTHTHANWVFTEPGVHLVKLAVTAGEHTADAVLRFVVSDSQASDAEISHAASAQWAGPGESTAAEDSSAVDPILLVGIGLFALAIIIVTATLWLRRK